ncbi:MAG: hypothetical protein KGQ36_06710 [Rickettsiales bacterium]|nr:hypothetical protein [Rickettsiales bacterium]
MFKIINYFLGDDTVVAFNFGMLFLPLLVMVGNVLLIIWNFHKKEVLRFLLVKLITYVIGFFPFLLAISRLSSNVIIIVFAVLNYVSLGLTTLLYVAFVMSIANKMAKSYNGDNVSNVVELEEKFTKYKIAFNNIVMVTIILLYLEMALLLTVPNIVHKWF